MGDRGPSCPQCRFFLTGPAFLLGQTISGNQLIFKIRAKTKILESTREKIMDAEDEGDIRTARLLRGQHDIEERQLNDMLAEWWHRMRFYEASRKKLEVYRASVEDTKDNSITVALEESNLPDPNWSVQQATELELQHFLSTCAELLPDAALDTKPAVQDLEIAVAKFLAANEKSDLASLYFTLDDEDRLVAANLTVELLLQASIDPSHASALLEGREKINAVGRLNDAVEHLFSDGLTKALNVRKRQLSNALVHAKKRK
jgi:hypothetical protein